MDNKDKNSRQLNVSFVAIVLGIVSVLIAMAIGFYAYRYSLRTTEESYHEFYLNKARMLASVAGYYNDADDDDDVLSAIEAAWVSFGDKPTDEYVCVIDENAILLLHTAYKDIIGSYVGDNSIIDSRDQRTNTLRKVSKSQLHCVGDYTSTKGQKQIVAYAAIKERQWTLGVHRSKDALINEIKSGIFHLVIGFIIVCGLILPVSLVVLYWAFRISNRKRVRAEEELIKHQKHLEELVEKRTVELEVVNEQLQSDIAERKRAEEQLRKLSHAVEQSNSTVVITDIKGNIEYVNPIFTQLTNYTTEEAIGQNPRILKSDKTPPEVYKCLWETIMSGNEWRGEFCNKKKDGELYWESASISPIKNTEGVITHFIAVKEDITQHKQADEQIKKSLKEKVVLLKEIHHRVKNNMQVISSLLNMQLKHIKDKKLIDIFKESQSRIKTMSLIHEELYKREDLATIDFAEYVRTLTSRLAKSYLANPGSVLIDINIDKVFPGVDVAIPCGLIINELFVNSLKYAFSLDDAQSKSESKKNEICIKFHHDNNKYTLIYSDNGVGLPDDFDFENTKTLGLELVNTLAQQLGGTIEVVKSEGAKFKIMFESD